MVDLSYQFTIHDDGNVSTFIPIELIWTEEYKFIGKEIEGISQEWKDFNALWAGKSILRLKPHIDLYEGIVEGKSNLSNYTQWYKSIFSTRNLECPLDDASIIDLRYESFRVFHDEIEVNGLSGDLLKIKAKYDFRRNIFIIDDGHHRATYLRMRGYRKIPALISYDDWQSWLNINYTKSVNDLINGQGRNLIYTPVLNPMVRLMQVSRDNHYKSRLDHLMHFLGDRMLDGKIIDIGSNTGFFSFHFLREGMEVTGCDPYRDHFELAVKLGDLYRLPHRFICGSAEDLLDQERDFRGCLLLTVLYHLINLGRHIPLLKRIDQGVSDYIIWESGDNPEEEKNIIHRNTKFNNYVRISTTYATGKVREMGIFFIDGWFRGNL